MKIKINKMISHTSDQQHMWSLNICIDKLNKWEILYNVGDSLSQRNICHYLMSLKMACYELFHSYIVGKQFCICLTYFCTSWKKDSN